MALYPARLLGIIPSVLSIMPSVLSIIPSVLGVIRSCTVMIVVLVLFEPNECKILVWGQIPYSPEVLVPQSLAAN